jgi:predicted dehydrogenase
VIRLGIVGCNYGRAVLLPAFRADPRCQVVALAGSDAARTRELARDGGIPASFGRWEDLVAHDDIDAVAIATPPGLQPEIAVRALRNGKPVFAEKPLAADLAGAAAILAEAQASARPVAVDFEFPEIAAWRRAKALIDAGALGALRHVTVNWHVETHAARMRLQSWKTSGRQGGGALGNFVSHCFYYLEHFCGPIRDLSARTFGIPGEDPPSESSVAMSGTFASGAAFMLSMSAASYLGSGHRIEFYGEDGTLILWNATADYIRGFKLFHSRRPAPALEQIACEDDDDDDFPDGRIGPVSRLAARFLDAIERSVALRPGIAEGVRVQKLIETARRSNTSGAKIMSAGS